MRFSSGLCHLFVCMCTCNAHTFFMFENKKQENKNLNKMIDKFKVTLKIFINWLRHKFSYQFEDELIRNFEKETITLILKSNLI